MVVGSAVVVATVRVPFSPRPRWKTQIHNGEPATGPVEMFLIFELDIDTSMKRKRFFLDDVE